MSSLGWVAKAVVLRLAAVGLTAVVGLVGAARLGAAEFGLVAVSLATTGFVAPIGSGGLGRVALRDLPSAAGDRPRSGDGRLQPLPFLRARSVVAASALVGAGLGHLGLVAVVLATGGTSSGHALAIAGAGALHSIAASAVTVVTDLLRAQGRDALADLTNGRLGGGLAALVALALFEGARLSGRHPSPTGLVLTLAIGCTVATLIGVAALGWPRGRSPADRAEPEPPTGPPPLRIQLRDWAGYSSALAVAPLVAATPVWLAPLVLEPSTVGAFGLAAQSVGLIGAIGFAIQSRQMAHLATGGPSSDPGRTARVQERHDLVGPVLLLGVLTAYGAVAGLALLGADLVIPEASAPFLRFALVLGGAQVWIAAMGMSGLQLQLSGHPFPVAAVGLGRAGITAALIVALPPTVDGFVAAVAVPAFAAALVLNRVALATTGIRATAVGPTTIRRLVAARR